MRHYEIVLLVHPDQSDLVHGTLSRYREMVTATQGAVHRVEDWGRRILAYPIGDSHKAHYVMLNVECDLPTLRELERSFKFNDSIMRSLVIRRDRAHTEVSAMAKAKAEEDARLKADLHAGDAFTALEAEARAKAAGRTVPRPAKPAADDADTGNAAADDAGSGEAAADNSAADASPQHSPGAQAESASDNAAEAANAAADDAGGEKPTETTSQTEAKNA